MPATSRMGVRLMRRSLNERAGSPSKSMMRKSLPVNSTCPMRLAGRPSSRTYAVTVPPGQACAPDLKGVASPGSASTVYANAMADIPLALFSFNVGIELGQLVFVATVLAVRPLVRSVGARGPQWLEQLPELPDLALSAMRQLGQLEAALGDLGHLPLLELLAASIALQDRRFGDARRSAERLSGGTV